MAAVGGAAVALVAAASWGGGDFSGGMSVKAIGGTPAGALRVVMLSHATSFTALLLICWFAGARVPHGAPLVWAVCGGATASVALMAFYIALSRGAMGPSAAISGLLAAAIPAVVSSALEGSPGWLRLVGFALAAIAIWAIAAGDTKDSPGTMLLAVLGGLGFGIYFVAGRMANSLGVFEPMLLARAGSLVTCGLLWLIAGRRGACQPINSAVVRWAMGVALLDTAGNLLFIQATRIGRLDTAAVVASLYPAGTILLAAHLLHERPTRRQLAGMALALVAVVMVSL